MFISDCLEPASIIADHLQSVQTAAAGRGQLAVVRVLTADEYEMPASAMEGRRALIDPEVVRADALTPPPSGTRRVPERAISIAPTQYNALMADHSRQLRSACDSAGIGFADVRTDEPAVDPLSRILLMLRRSR